MNEKPFRYTQRARPTVYNGTNYRSELEAAWAAFFDIRGIISEYEPALDLISWRPDFHVSLRDGDFVLAEVKPYLSEEQWRADKATLFKINESISGVKMAVLLGVSPIVPANFIFKITQEGGLPEFPEFMPLEFGPIEDVTADWKRA